MSTSYLFALFFISAIICPKSNNSIDKKQISHTEMLSELVSNRTEIKFHPGFKISEIANASKIYDEKPFGTLYSFLKHFKYDYYMIKPSKEDANGNIMTVTRELFPVNFYNDQRRQNEHYLIEKFSDDKDGTGIMQELQNRFEYRYTNLREEVPKLYAVLDDYGPQIDYYLFTEISADMISPLGSKIALDWINEAKNSKITKMWYKLMMCVQKLQIKELAHNFLSFSSIWIDNELNFWIVINEFTSTFTKQVIHDSVFNPISHQMHDKYFEADSSSDIYSLAKLFLFFDIGYQDDPSFGIPGNLETLQNLIQQKFEVVSKNNTPPRNIFSSLMPFCCQTREVSRHKYQGKLLETCVYQILEEMIIDAYSASSVINICIVVAKDLEADKIYGKNALIENKIKKYAKTQKAVSQLAMSYVKKNLAVKNDLII